jgi:hypothetical protein
MTTPKQRAANRVNALKSTGPQSEAGKLHSKINSIKHGLSKPIDEHLYANQIKQISSLVLADCSNEVQAIELAKRIVDFERNEAFLREFDEDKVHHEIMAWGEDPRRKTLAALAQNLRNKFPVPITFTLPQKDRDVTLKGQERTEELKFIEDFLKLEAKVLLRKARTSKESKESALRYQKRAINQLVKGVRAVAKGEDL